MTYEFWLPGFEENVHCQTGIGLAYFPSLSNWLVGVQARHDPSRPESIAQKRLPPCRIATIRMAKSSLWSATISMPIHQAAFMKPASQRLRVPTCLDRLDDTLPGMGQAHYCRKGTERDGQTMHSPQEVFRDRCFRPRNPNLGSGLQSAIKGRAMALHCRSGEKQTVFALHNIVALTEY